MAQSKPLWQSDSHLNFSDSLGPTEYNQLVGDSIQTTRVICVEEYSATPEELTEGRDFDLISAWLKTDRGQWVLERAVNLPGYQRIQVRYDSDYMTYQTQCRVMARLTLADVMMYRLTF